MSDNICIVLVNPSHPGNIGATARAMKTMGLKDLTLVNPKVFPDMAATAMAAGADDILARAMVTNSLATALTNIKIVFGTSARTRYLSLKTLRPDQSAQIIVRESKMSNVAILFGRENNGLTNEELAMCNYQIHIPTAKNFGSLNIAAAVQLIAYEIKIKQDATKNTTTTLSSKEELASTKDVQSFFAHLEHTLTGIKFLNQNNQKRLMAKIKRLFNRAQLETNEVSILRGILTAIQSR